MTDYTDVDTGVEVVVTPEEMNSLDWRKLSNGQALAYYSKTSDPRDYMGLDSVSVLVKEHLNTVVGFFNREKILISTDQPIITARYKNGGISPYICSAMWAGRSPVDISPYIAVQELAPSTVNPIMLVRLDRHLFSRQSEVSSWNLKPDQYSGRKVLNLADGMDTSMLYGRIHDFALGRTTSVPEDKADPFLPILKQFYSFERPSSASSPSFGLADSE